MIDIVMMGPPGAGKGTQAKFLSHKLDIPHISTGDMLREEMASGSDLGRKVENVIKSGGLVEDELMIDIIRERLSKKDVTKGFILDGFPRTISQAQALDDLLSSLKRAVDYALYIEVPEEIIVERLSSRRVCPKCGRVYNVITNPPKHDEECDVCGTKLIVRDDDKPETVRRRFEVYMKQTAPVIDYYREQGKLFTIDGKANVEEVRKELLSVLGEIDDKA